MKEEEEEEEGSDEEGSSSWETDSDDDDGQGLTVCSWCTAMPLHTRRVLIPGLSTAPLISSTSLFAHNVTVYPCTFAASSSLASPLSPFRHLLLPETSDKATQRC